MKYEEFKSTPVLYEAYKKTRRGKRSKKAEAIFESSETENLKRIARQIDKGYLPAGLDSFMIYEPKARTINAPAYPRNAETVGSRLSTTSKGEWK